MPTIRLDSVTKTYKTKRDRHLAAVRDLTLTIEQGEFVFIIGSSGAGKSTILKLLTGAQKPSRGNVYLDSLNITKAPPWAQKQISKNFGQMHQQPQLLRRKTISQNLFAAAKAAPFSSKPEIDEKIKKVLGIVGISGVEKLYPSELSVSDVRRVDLARALINSPHILVLDELAIAEDDDDTGWDLMQLLMDINRQGTTVIMATHATNLINIMRRRVITLVDGRIASDIRRGKYDDILGMPRPPHT